MDTIVGAMLVVAVGTPDGMVLGASDGKVVRRVVGAEDGIRGPEGRALT